MDEVIVGIIERLGYLGIAILMALENIFPPLPSEAIMGAGALAVINDRMSFWPLLIFGTIGTVAGNYAWFWFGNRVGYERLGPFIDKWGRWLTLEWEDIERASEFFQKHGQWAVFFLRFFPVMRTMISLPAGLAHMNVWKFLIFTTAGAAIWNVLLILGAQWLVGTFSNVQDLVGWVLIGSLVLAAAGYGWRLYSWKPRAER
ncbi:DedA family protein [Citromicrobium bathyomarinum]|uniref:DedA family protein n=1 Tax=Citromicrobium bathyomarinum TaxID=72174 RepID=UPI00315A343B